MGAVMRLALPFVILAAALAVPGHPADSPKPAEAAKPKKPKLDLRATPRMAFSPVNVLLTAELTGVHEADCPEYEAGVSKIERRFTAEHEYGKAGLYNVKLTMRRANRTLAQTT